MKDPPNILFELDNTTKMLQGLLQNADESFRLTFKLYQIQKVGRISYVKFKITGFQSSHVSSSYLYGLDTIVTTPIENTTDSVTSTCTNKDSKANGMENDSRFL